MRNSDAPIQESPESRFKKALLERALGAELGHHLAQEGDAADADAPANHRNGSSAKTVLTDDGALPLVIPRDRHGTFAPVLIPKHQQRFTGFDDKILALYARGLTVRDIQAFLQEMSAVEVSPSLISAVTDAVQKEVAAWQIRPLEPMYPVVFFDALRVKTRDEGLVQNKAVYLALAILPHGPGGRGHADDGGGGPGLFPSDEAATKLIWLAIRNLMTRWVRSEHHWKDAMNQFAILYGDRFERPQV